MGEKGRVRERKGKQEYRAILEKKKRKRKKRKYDRRKKNRYSHSFYLLDSRNQCIEVSFYY